MNDINNFQNQLQQQQFEEQNRLFQQQQFEEQDKLFQQQQFEEQDKLFQQQQFEEQDRLFQQQMVDEQNRLFQQQEIDRYNRMVQQNIDEYEQLNDVRNKKINLKIAHHRAVWCVIFSIPFTIFAIYWLIEVHAMPADDWLFQVLGYILGCLFIIAGGYEIIYNWGVIRYTKAALDELDSKEHR